MLFDPNSGSMITAKKTRPSNKSPRGAEGAGSDSKQLRGGKQGGRASRKDDTARPKRDKQRRTPQQRRTPRKRIPRTCGVLYKLDKASGNYVNVDNSEPDNGYGAHLVPGGKVKNSNAYTKLLKKEEDEQNQAAQLGGVGDITLYNVFGEDVGRIVFAFDLVHRQYIIPHCVLNP